MQSSPGGPIVRPKKRFNELTLKAVPERAAILAERHPELKDAIECYVARQFEEIALMEGPLVTGLWAIRKAGA